jgi:aminopeptidase YwaD
MKFVRAMLLLFVLPQLLAAQTIDTMDLRARTRFLSADALRGRGTGTAGERIAAEYIASELTRLGVQPVTNDSYFQRVPLKRAVISKATLRFNSATYGASDFVWNTGGRGAFHNFRGPITYVGMIDSVAIRRAGELRGQVVVLTGTMGAAALNYVPALIQSGAAGVVIATADTTIFNLYSRSRGDARYFVDAAIDDPVWQADLPVVIAGPSLSRQLLARERFTRIEGEIQTDVQARLEDVSSVNVAGIIRGANARLADEVIAYTAHYDHLGVSTPDARGDSIYNGFSDNAAGVAMLLGIAELMKRTPPARSVMFLFFTGEERGLLGSSYYVAHPLLPLTQMKGVINLDAGAPPAPPVSWRIAGGQGSALGQLAQNVAVGQKWTADLGTATPNSDYWPFLQHKVPSIFIIPGNQWENTTAEQQAALRTRWDRYHRADDEYHVDFPFSGMARYGLFAFLVGRAAAN